MARQPLVLQDSLGDIPVPHGVLFGASTARALLNFPTGGPRLPTEFIRMLARIKAEAAQVNAGLGELDQYLADAIVGACDAIAAGTHDDQFPLSVYQTGSGTSTNMNMNEVIARLASSALGEAVHPNDHVNRGQSSNDVFPTAIHVAAAVAVQERLLPALQNLATVLRQKSEQFGSIRKSGRTHLQNAVPLTLGQEFGGYATQVEKAMNRVQSALQDLYELPIGGTAVGTGMNAHAEFGARLAAALGRAFKQPFVEAKDHFEAQSSRDACVQLSGSLKTAAVSLSLIADNIRWLGSEAIGELILPAVQPGSSIMPGKVNPVLCESLLQICAQVIGNDGAVTHGGLLGNFQLNTAMPLIAHNLLQSIELLAEGVQLFVQKCAVDLRADEETIGHHLSNNLMVVTALAPSIGYDRAAEIAKKARAERLSIRDAAIALGIDTDTVDRALGR